MGWDGMGWDGHTSQLELQDEDVYDDAEEEEDEEASSALREPRGPL